MLLVPPVFWHYLDGNKVFNL